MNHNSTINKPSLLHATVQQMITAVAVVIDENPYSQQNVAHALTQAAENGGEAWTFDNGAKLFCSRDRPDVWFLRGYAPDLSDAYRIGDRLAVALRAIAFFDRNTH